MSAALISGIQQVGLGVQNVPEAWQWYRRILGFDVPVFDDKAEAPLMTPYTGEKFIRDMQHLPSIWQVAADWKSGHLQAAFHNPQISNWNLEIWGSMPFVSKRLTLRKHMPGLNRSQKRP